MKPLKNRMFMIEFVEDDGGYRSVIRGWNEVPGYVEIAHQEFDRESGEWVDNQVSVVYSREDLTVLRDSLNIILENFV